MLRRAHVLANAKACPNMSSCISILGHFGVTFGRFGVSSKELPEDFQKTFKELPGDFQRVSLELPGDDAVT